MAAAGNGTERTRSTGLSSERTNIGVLGGGAWGTALALHAARMGHDVLLWALEPEVVQQVNEEHENKTYLKVWHERALGQPVARWARGWLGNDQAVARTVQEQQLCCLLHVPALWVPGTQPGCSMLPTDWLHAGLHPAGEPARLGRHPPGGVLWRDHPHGHPHTLCGAHGKHCTSLVWVRPRAQLKFRIALPFSKRPHGQVQPGFLLGSVCMGHIVIMHCSAPPLCTCRSARLWRPCVTTPSWCPAPRAS